MARRHPLPGVRSALAAAGGIAELRHRTDRDVLAPAAREQAQGDDRDEDATPVRWCGRNDLYSFFFSAGPPFGTSPSVLSCVADVAGSLPGALAPLRSSTVPP